MTITSRVRGEEILIRLGEEGIKGAQYQTIKEVIEDGKVIAAQPSTVQPLSLFDGDENTQSLGSLLGEVTATALVQNEALTSALRKANEVAADLLNTNTGLQEQLATKNDRIKELEELVAELQAAQQTVQEDAEGDAESPNVAAAAQA